MTSASKARIRYLVGGLLIGGFWYLNRHRAPWQEALRTLATFALLMTLLRARLQRKSVHVHLVPLVAAKGALVIVAALVQTALGHTMASPQLIVAFGLGLAVALLGPFGDKHFFTPRPTTSAPTLQEIDR
jgi:hypothetical protein